MVVTINMSILCIQLPNFILSQCKHVVMYNTSVIMDLPYFWYMVNITPKIRNMVAEKHPIRVIFRGTSTSMIQYIQL
jgi:hypothetical protein